MLPIEGEGPMQQNTMLCALASSLKMPTPNLAFNLAPFSRWIAMIQSAQRRLALR